MHAFLRQIVVSMHWAWAKAFGHSLPRWRHRQIRMFTRPSRN